MFLRSLVLAISLFLGVSACVAPRTIDAQMARSMLEASWQAGQHVVWEINWPAAPVGGPLTVETWRAEGRYRYEILESAAPALIGEILVFDGQHAWSYNRFAPEPPTDLLSPALPPVTEALAMISRLITIPPETATQRAVQSSHGPAQEIALTFPPEADGRGRTLIFWRDIKTGLPVWVRFSVGETQATLQARTIEPLADPLPGLFQRPIWKRTE
jgi:hypothetical protein